MVLSSYLCHCLSYRLSRGGLLVCQPDFRDDVRSVRMDRVKMVRYVRWGMMSSTGTDRGRLRNVGRRTVRTGTDSTRFDG